MEKAIRFLKKAGCKEVYLFGSLVKGNAKEDSDIDIAIRGLSPGYFFNIYGKLMSQMTHSVDLVDLDGNPRFATLLRKLNNIRRVA